MFLAKFNNCCLRHQQMIVYKTYTVLLVMYFKNERNEQFHGYFSVVKSIYYYVDILRMSNE